MLAQSLIERLRQLPETYHPYFLQICHHMKHFYVISSWAMLSLSSMLGHMCQRTISIEFVGPVLQFHFWFWKYGSSDSKYQCLILRSKLHRLWLATAISYFLVLFRARCIKRANSGKCNFLSSIVFERVLVGSVRNSKASFKRHTICMQYHWRGALMIRDASELCSLFTFNLIKSKTHLENIPSTDCASSPIPELKIFSTSV